MEYPVDDVVSVSPILACLSHTSVHIIRTCQTYLAHPEVLRGVVEARHGVVCELHR